mmetsp:Transcript_29041/g.72908  ORF Transcript_29041/g.72908 Transcript_29041/m.72908 type:complete len:152 (+) Transcript_29041:455-910(+)|eukprot:jgi/Tetstr1/436753/TSEL_025533.t1
MSSSKPGLLAGASKRKAPEEKAEPQFKKRGIFTKDLRMMMFGFGDVEQPLQQTVDTVEDVLVDYITEFVHQAMEQATKVGKVQKEDLLFQVRKDSRKFNRATELLYLEEKIKEAKSLLKDQLEDPDALAEAVPREEGDGGGGGGSGTPQRN